MRLTFSKMSLAMFLTMFLPVWQHLNECILFTIFADGSMYTFCLRLALLLRGIGAVSMHQHPLGHWKVQCDPRGSTIAVIQGRNSTLQYPLIFNIQLVIKYLPGWLKKVLKVISRNILVAALSHSLQT